MVVTRFVLLASLFSIATPARAQHGTIQEVLEAAYYGKEPAYIGDIVMELTKKIYPFVPDGIEERRDAERC